MNGIEMMLKSMGIQTDAIKAILNPETVKQTFDKLQKVTVDVEEIKASLLRLELKLETLPTNRTMQLLSENKDAATAELERLYGRDNSNSIE